MKLASPCEITESLVSSTYKADVGPLRQRNQLVGQKRGYGIRDVDGEYSDLADMVAFCTASPIHFHVNRLLEIAETKMVTKAELAAIAKADASLELVRQQRLKKIEDLLESQDHLVEEWKEFQRRDHERKAKLFQEIEEVRRRQQIESDILDKAFSENSSRQLATVEAAEPEPIPKVDQNKNETEEIAQREIENARKTEAETKQRSAFEDQQKLERLTALKLKEDKEKAAIQAKAEQERAETEKYAALVKLQEESSRPHRIGSAPSHDTRVPLEFQKCITFEDLQKYTKSQHILDDIQEKTKHITNTSKFYSGAIKVVNAPLNQISAQTNVKISHFTTLFEGKTVNAPGLSTSFSITHERFGDVFVKNLFAFRFVKKAEADASENKLKRENLNYLAIVGVSLIKKFPDLEELIQAHFYKACPFLVPFNYPRNGMDIRTYAAAIGQHVSISDNHNTALEASITQTVLEKLAGYCLLYGFMVRNMCSHLGATKGNYPSNSFFSLKEVWKILATTLSLAPQDEVTATILHSLLEILDKLLGNTYRHQYKKVLKHMKEVYVEKIRKITSKGKSGSLSRLELLLERIVT